MGFFDWVGDYLTASSFLAPFSCGQLIPDSSANGNVSQFCNHAVDAAVAAQGTDANVRWAALDHRLLAAAPAVPLFSRRSLMLLSDRVGNAQMNRELGPLLDQFWVR